ncbi:unnamed protein product, partial [Iphiclides podalirius]
MEAAPCPEGRVGLELTWLLRTVPFAHSGRSIYGDEEYVTGDLSGHGRNGGGERHVRGCRRYGSIDKRWLFDWRPSPSCCYQHRAAYPTCTSSISSGNVILVSKPSSVIHTTQGTLQTLQIKPEPNSIVNTQGQSCSDESCSDDESPKRKYREMLTRRPSYRKILNDLGGAEIAVIPAGAIQTESGLHTLAVSGAAGGGAIVQYATNQDGQFYVPGPILEDQTRKRELRLLKNREAARECRRKKKEYIKCLENRVAVLENQNKALIEELKSLKELYCQQKTE